MDERNAVAGRVARRAQLDGLTFNSNTAGIGLIDAAEKLHQSRFAGAVFANESENLSASDF